MSAASEPSRGAVVWFTGLPGSGKSTLAEAVEGRLRARGRAATGLDGDRLRTGLCADLGFSPEARRENVRRVGHVAALLADAGVVALVSLVSPYRQDRAMARDIVGGERFLEVYLEVPLEVCEARDPKGMYARARAGDLPGFTGVGAPYEAPEAADLVLPTHDLDLDSCVGRILARLGAEEPCRG